jgi:hypothetical protein
VAEPLRIFINYRREETSGHAGRLYDALTDRFGEPNVFMDIDTIEPGVDFSRVVDEHVGACDVLIAVIGRQWTGVVDREGVRRLERPEDWVRLEIARALERDDIRIIPALVQDAEMPTSGDLPEPLRALAYRNAIELSDERWRYDVGRLVRALERVEEQKAQRAAREAEEAAAAATGAREAEEAERRGRQADAAAAAEREREEREAREREAREARDREAQAARDRERAAARREPPADRDRPPAARQPSRTPRILAMAAAVAVLLVIALVLLLPKGDDTTPTATPSTTSPASNLSERTGAVPEGSFVLLRNAQGSDPRGLYLVEPGSDTAKHIGPTNALAPDVSPQRDRIVFTAGPVGPRRGQSLQTMRPDGTDLKTITPQGDYDHFFTPKWSPDGTKIAFSSDRGEPPSKRCGTATRSCDFDIYVVDADGTNLRQLTHGSGAEQGPTWSPDGRQIAYTAELGEFACRIAREAGRQCLDDLMIMDADGGNPRSVDRKTSTTDPRLPAWSPDGKLIAYQAMKGSDPQIEVIDPDTGFLSIRLAAKAPATWPQWSADSKRIFFLRKDDEPLWSAAPDGSGQRKEDAALVAAGSFAIAR